MRLRFGLLPLAGCAALACGDETVDDRPRLITEDLFTTEAPLSVSLEGATYVVREVGLARRIVLEREDGATSALGDQLLALDALSPHLFPIELRAPLPAAAPQPRQPARGGCGALCKTTWGGTLVVCTQSCLCPSRPQWPSDYCGRGTFGAERQLKWIDDLPPGWIDVSESPAASAPAPSPEDPPASSEGPGSGEPPGAPSSGSCELAGGCGSDPYGGSGGSSGSDRSGGSSGSSGSSGGHSGGASQGGGYSSGGGGSYGGGGY